jgi:hypothetical protein
MDTPIIQTKTLVELLARYPGIRDFAKQASDPPLASLMKIECDKDDAYAYYKLLDFQIERPDLRHLLDSGSRVFSLVNRDLAPSRRAEAEYCERGRATLPSECGEEVDLLFHRMFARAFVVLSGNKLRRLVTDALQRNVAIDSAWDVSYEPSGVYRLSCWLPYLAPDAAYDASIAINSPSDGAHYGDGHQALRHRNWGLNPCNLLFRLDEFFIQRPGKPTPRDVLHTLDGWIYPVYHHIEDLPVTMGFAERYAADPEAYVGGVDEDKWRMDAVILDKTADWSFDSVNGKNDTTTVRYRGDASPVTAIQRILSIQHCYVHSPAIELVRSETWAPPPVGRRKRRARGGRGQAKRGL